MDRALLVRPCAGSSSVRQKSGQGRLDNPSGGQSCTPTGATTFGRRTAICRWRFPEQLRVCKTRTGYFPPEPAGRQGTEFVT
ncbi:hypothetical protein [Sorangium sp. So ce362]|uniref:hypothetical protein n=1 Tax=Sorangium sp. So ce362 TaxID=3133303 RepID=UPI003F5DF1AB